MTEIKRFKFQSFSKIAKSIKLSAYDDILSFSARDDNGRPRCFKITLTNILRAKDVLKFQSHLREIQKTELYNNLNEDSDFSHNSSECLQKPLEIMLNCMKDSSPVELDYICRLMAAYFKDFGNNDSLKVPYDDLLETIEMNTNLNSKPIFTFIVTYFKAHTSYILKNVESILNGFLQWLDSRNALIKRLSMESLGMLLRRAPMDTIKDVISLCIHIDGAEKIIFPIIQNIDGNFTSKAKALFTFMFEDLIPNRIEQVSQVVENIRKTILLMSTHAKDNRVDVSWLKDLYKYKLTNLSENICKIDLKCLCTVLELSIEMLITFNETRFTTVKEYPLITKGDYFSIFFSNFIVPLLQFANFSRKTQLFEDICSYLMRIVRSGSESTEVLDQEFEQFLANVDHNLVGMNNINSFLSLFEWRLNTSNLNQISHILLVLSSILTKKDIFHPLLVNPSIIQRLYDCVDFLVYEIEYKIMKFESFLDLFGILYGLSCINKVIIKSKASKVGNKDKLFQRILSQVLLGLEEGYDPRVMLKLYTIAFNMLEKNKQSWVENLISSALRLHLFNNYFLVQFLVENFNDSVSLVVEKVVENLPHENENLRINAIKLVQLYYTKITPEVSKLLEQFLEFESLPNEIESGRKKCIIMSRAVNSIDFQSIKGQEIQIFTSLVKRILMSQYFVKFSPLWEGALSANVSLLGKLKPYEKSLNDTWDLYMNNLRNITESKEPEFINRILESALNYQYREKTDPVTIQFNLLKVIFEIVSTVKDKDGKLEDLIEYTLGHFKEQTEFLRNALCTVSSIITKFNYSNYKDELLNSCVTIGLKSKDPKVREHSLLIISKRNKIDTKRLSEMCTGNFQQIIALTSKFPYSDFQCESEEDKMSLNLSMGIEIRLLVPRIYQHSNISHGNTIIDYFTNFEAKYIDLLLVELLPNDYSNLFKSGNSDQFYTWMVEVLKFGKTEYTFHLPNVLTTLNLIIKRLINHLKPQALDIMCFCCLLLKKNKELSTSDSKIVVERTFKIMIELVSIFGTGYFVELLSQFSEDIVNLIKAFGIDFVIKCTSDMEHIDRFCTRVVRDLFPSVFENSLTQKHIALAYNIYNLYPNHLKKFSLPENKEMLSLMVNSSETLLDSMDSSGNYNCDLLSDIVFLNLSDLVSKKALSIFISSLPSRPMMSKSVKLNVKRDVDLWKKILKSMESCMHLVDQGDLESTELIWTFVDNVLSMVADNKCRSNACVILKKIPTNDEGVYYIGERLHSMNGVNVELKLDVDLNVEIISEIVQELGSKTLSFRCINSLLTHSLFLLSTNDKDPGVRRCVVTLSFKVLEMVKNRVENSINIDYGKYSEPTFILSNTLFPFIKRTLIGNVEDAIVSLCLEILERYSVLFNPLVNRIDPTLHSDLLSNIKIAECFHSMRELQKYRKCKGLKNLKDMIESNCFSNQTLLKLIVPICIQFLIQRNSVRNVGLSDVSKHCLISSCKQLPLQSFIKMLKKLIQIYESCKLPVVLTIFSSVTKMRLSDLTESRRSSGPFKDTLGVGQILSKLKKLSVVEGKNKMGDVPVPEVFECLGYLFNYYPESIVNKELIMNCRILAKFLISRNRDVRRLARISLINLAKPFKVLFIDVFIRELFTNMTKGYKCSVLIFTIYSILNKVLDDENVLAKENQMKLLYSMILDEISRNQEKDDSKSKIDEARHPKSSQLISLISQYSTIEVVEMNFTFLFSLLNGNLVSNKTELLEYSDKFLRRVNELIVSATSGVILNKNIDQIRICYKLFITMLPMVRGIDKYINQFPEEIVELYTKCLEDKISDVMEISKPEVRSVEEGFEDKGYFSRLKERYTVLPGASTGKSFESSLKKPGFETNIFSPLFVNSAIRLFTSIISNNPVYEENKVMYRLCEFSVITTFLTEEVILQKSSCNCLLKLCKSKPDIVDDFGLVLASNLVDRIGSLDQVGSEDLAKEHIELISIFFNKYLDLLYEAWERSKRKGKLVECLILQIETNLNRPRLQTSLLKLLIILIQSTIKTNTFTINSSNLSNSTLLNGYHDHNEVDPLDVAEDSLNGKESLSVYFNKEFYSVTYEIMIKMLKGSISTRSTSVVSKVVAYSFILLPMDENMRSKRFSLLLKHINSSDPQVRFLVLKTLSIIMRELPGPVVWKRYAVLLVLALLPQLVLEYDSSCRKLLQLLITRIWSSGNKDNKNQLLDVVAHFVGKMKKHSNLAFSFFTYLSLKTETSLHNLNKLNLRVLLRFIDDINHNHWQNCYYWLMLLEHLLGMEVDLTKEFQSKIWKFAITQGISSNHPWVLASSLRILSHVLPMKKLEILIPDFNTTIFSILKSSFRSLSIYSPSIERHKKLAYAILDVFIKSINVLSKSKTKSLERLISKLCYILRCNLGRKAECKERINIILEIFSHLVGVEKIYEPKHRVLVLKVIIALFRVAHTKPAGISHKRVKEVDTSQSDKASGILDKIEDQFNKKDSPTEYLKLLSFARNFVLKSRLVKKKQLAISMVTNTKIATLRKLKRNKKKRRKFKD